MGAFVVIHGTTGVLAPMASYRALDLGVGASGLGLLTTAFSVFPLVVALRIGRIVDRHGGVAFMAGGLLLMAIAGVGIAAAPSPTWVYGAFAVLGLGHMTAVIAAQGIVAKASDDHTYDQRFSTLSFAASLGQLVGPVLGGIVAGQGSPEETTRALLVGAGLATRGLPLVLWMRPRLVARMAGGSMEAPAAAPVDSAAPAGRTDSAAPAGGRPRGPSQLSQPSRPGQPGPSLLSIAQTPGMIRAILVSTMVLSATDIIIVYLPALGDERGWPAALVGGLLAVRAASSMGMRLVLGRLVARFGRRVLLGGALLVSAAALVALPAAGPVPLIVALMVVAGAGLGMGQPLTMSWVASIATPSARATALSVRLMGNRLGQLAIPAATGTLAAVTGAGGVLAATGLLLAIGLTGLLGGPAGIPGRSRPPRA